MIRSQPKRRACSALLKEWQACLDLSPLEKIHFGGENQALSEQIYRLENRHARIAAFGRVGVGKSSLLNALFGKKVFATDIAHGFTREAKGIQWNHSIANLKSIELVDTPGINEITEQKRDLSLIHI